MLRKSTRNAKGSGTIRKRTDGRWEAMYTIGTDPGTGKQVRRSVYGKTQGEVAKKLREITSAIDDGSFMEPAKMTVGTWLDVWLKEYTGHLKERTLLLYTGHVNNRIKPALGAVRLSALTTPMIQAFYNDMQRGDRPLSPKSISNIHGVLHKALEQAMELGSIRANPCDACKLPRVEKPEIKPLEDDGINRFLEAIVGHPFERAFVVDLFTGIRQGELLGLTWDCVDFEKGTIYVYRQLQLLKGQYKFTSLKNDKTRRITPAQFVMEVLREQRRVQAEWRLLAGSAWVDGSFVFTNEIGEHLKRQTLYRAFKDVVDSIGLPATRFHDMRHTYAVSSFRAGDDPKTVQGNLGHHSAAFTLDQYGHVTEQMQRESAARMDDFIKVIKSKLNR